MSALGREERLKEIQGGMTGCNMAASLGIHPSTWVLRKNRFINGEITEDQLLGGKCQARRDDPLNTYQGEQKTDQEMADLLEITVGSWLCRKHRYRHGECGEDVLYHKGNVVPRRRSNAGRRNSKLSALSDSPRTENLRQIKTGTMEHLL